MRLRRAAMGVGGGGLEFAGTVNAVVERHGAGRERPFGIAATKQQVSALARLWHFRPDVLIASIEVVSVVKAPKSRSLRQPASLSHRNPKLALLHRSSYILRYNNNLGATWTPPRHITMSPNSI